MRAKVKSEIGQQSGAVVKLKELPGRSTHELKVNRSELEHMIDSGESEDETVLNQYSKVAGYKF